ncbi:magnesium transporter CorA family protein [Lysobacter xanthus]
MPARPAETKTTPESAPVAPELRALLFESDQVSREVDASSLQAYADIADHRLLWVNAVVPDGAPDDARALGADPDLLDPDGGGALGLVVAGDWKYLHVRALNWHDGQKPADIPIAVGIGPNVVITVHRGHVDFIAGVLDNEADHLRVGRLEATSFAAGLLDRMLTDYLDARDEFETALDKLELLILRRPRPAYLAQLQNLRHLASRLRRYLASQRDLFDALGRPDFDPRQSESAERHCRILSGRYTQVMASVEAARELVNGSFDLYTSRAAESTNEVVFTLTVVTVAMGLAATVAGVFGMNFEMPWHTSGPNGFLIAGGVIAAVVIASGGWAIWRLARLGR